MKDCLINLDPMDIDNNLVEAGRGDVDFKSIIDYGLKNGVKYFCIEQDHSKGNMLESMKESLEYLKSLVN